MKKQNIVSCVLLVSVLACMNACMMRPEQPMAVPPPPPAPATPILATAPVPDKDTWKASASAMQEDIFPASLACDGKKDTRWSSPASDPQHLIIDLGATSSVCGLTILWETAYSSEYTIESSLDGKAWTPVYANLHADGNTDEIYFRATPARFIKILGLKRGTGWVIPFSKWT